MKKITIMAVAAMFATTAFAQNPDALKQIKKLKSVAEVQQAIKANESSMTAAENAQAYNKLVDLFVKEVAAQQSAIEANNLAKQMGQAEKENVDMNSYYANLTEAFNAALVCDKYDVQPNDKGKVAPKFRSSNGNRLYNYRVNLINAGQEAQNAEDNVKAAELYGLYVTTGKAELFKSQQDNAAKMAADGIGDQYLSEVARVAAVTSLNNGDPKAALQYVDVVMENPAQLKDGLNLKMYILERNAKTKEDSLACVAELEGLYKQYPNDNDVFAQLAQWYSNVGKNDAQKQLIAERLQTDPQNFSAWAMKGQTEMNEQKYDEAIESLKKSLGCPTEDAGQKALVNTYIGFCYNQKAATLDSYDAQKELLEAAIPFLEDARQLDPERERSNWAYPLYQCYYHTKGENDPATVELKNVLGL